MKTVRHDLAEWWEFLHTHRRAMNGLDFRDVQAMSDDPGLRVLEVCWQLVDKCGQEVAFDLTIEVLSEPPM